MTMKVNRKRSCGMQIQIQPVCIQATIQHIFRLLENYTILTLQFSIQQSEPGIPTPLVITCRYIYSLSTYKQPCSSFLLTLQFSIQQSEPSVTLPLVITCRYIYSLSTYKQPCRSFLLTLRFSIQQSEPSVTLPLVRTCRYIYSLSTYKQPCRSFLLTLQKFSSNTAVFYPTV